jgi:hypothetical protein
MCTSSLAVEMLALAMEFSRNEPLLLFRGLPVRIRPVVPANRNSSEETTAPSELHSVPQINLRGPRSGHDPLFHLERWRVSPRRRSNSDQVSE